MRGSLVTRTGKRGTSYYVVLRGRWYRCPGDTRRAAEAYRAQLVATLQGGGPLVDEPVSLAVFAERWLASRADELAPSTLDAYRRVLRTMVLPSFGARLLAAVSAEDLARWRTRMARSHAPATITLAIAVLRQLYRTALDWQVVRLSPVTRLRSPRNNARPPEALTAAQMAAVLRACPGPDVTAIVLLAATGGLRVGEVCAARWEHLDERARTYYVAGTFSEARGDVGPPKTRSSQARVLISPACLAALAAHRARGEQALGEQALGKQASGWMFLGATGERLALASAQTMWRRLCLAAGIAPCTFHVLRHTCAATLIDRGAHPKLIQTQMRHATIGMTLDTYGHLFPARQDEAVAGLDAAYGMEAPGETI